jgi:hypothetical protein
MKYMHIYLLLFLSVSVYFSSLVQAGPELLVDYSQHNNKYGVPEKKQDAYEYHPKTQACEYINSRATDVSFGIKSGQTLLLIREGCNHGHADQNSTNYLLVYEGRKQVAKLSVPGMTSIDAVSNIDLEYNYLILSGGFFNMGGGEVWAEMYNTSSGKLKLIKHFNKVDITDCASMNPSASKSSKIFYDPVVSSFSSQEVVEACSK